MDFNFTEEQSMLRDTVASFLQDRYDFDKRRKMITSDAGRDPAIWEAFANELGILGAPFAEDLGGLGGGAIENMIVMEEFGKALVVEPYLGTVVIGGGFLKHSGYAGAADLIGGIIEGKTIIAFAYAEPQGRYTWSDLKTTAKKDGAGYVINGHKAVVVGAPWATHLIVTARTGGGQRDTDGVSVFIVEKGAKGVVTRDYPTVDGQRASEVYFENVSVGADALIGKEGGGLPLVEKVLDEATAAACAEAVGAMRQLHTGTLEYARQRKQFGVPIGSFQALQHRMADVLLEIEQARSSVINAAAALGADRITRERALSAAKYSIGRIGTQVAEESIQLHGGIGMTWELPMAHYAKRLVMIDHQLGDEDHHLARYMALTAD